MTVSFEDIDDIIIKGHTVKSKGLAKFDSHKIVKDIEILGLNIGGMVKPNFRVVEYETVAKKYYTVEILNNYLENPLKKSKGKQMQLSYM